MAEWLYEDGIGERRAALVEDGSIVAIGIERDSDGVRAGAVVPARRLPADGGGLTRVLLDSGEETICPALPRSLGEGAPLLVRIVRSAIPEADLVKRAKAHPADEGAEPTDGPDLAARIAASGHAVRTLRSHEPDAMEAASWSEALAAATSGRIAFDGGVLRVALTPAMTVIDVDGRTPAPVLAQAGALAAAAAIACFDIAGSIIIDLPTLPDKAARVAVAEVFDAALPPPFERTAINGFGLLQVIRPRLRQSIAERLHFAPVESAALAALRRAERAQGTGVLTLRLSTAVAEWLNGRPALVETLARRTARVPVLIAETGRAIGAIDVD